MKTLKENTQRLNYRTTQVKHGFSRDDLIELFQYDKSTGEIFWKDHYHKRFIGKKAGSVETLGKTGHYQRLRVSIKGHRFMAHHIIWCLEYGYWLDDRDYVMDHIDGNALNNHIDNLRIVTYAENSRNAIRLPQNKTGVAGVVFVKDRNKYRVRIRDWNGKKISLGCYDTLEEAREARKEAEIRYGYHENYGREA